MIDELAKRLEIDPIEFRLKNAAKEGTKTAYGPKFGQIGLVQTLEAARAHPHYRAPLKANQGRGVASGFWFNIGGETCATLNLSEDGGVTLVAGTPDIGGSRASLAMMAAEELGIALDNPLPAIKRDHRRQQIHARRQSLFNQRASDQFTPIAHGNGRQDQHSVSHRSQVSSRESVKSR